MPFSSDKGQVDNGKQSRYYYPFYTLIYIVYCRFYHGTFRAVEYDEKGEKSEKGWSPLLREVEEYLVEVDMSIRYLLLCFRPWLMNL